MERVWLRCSPGQLLWATRGHSWDFRILTPADAAGLDPLSLYEAVFSAGGGSPAIREGECRFFRAEVIDNAGSDCWVIGARFLDPEKTRRDEAGRPIPHEVLLVCKKDEAPAPNTSPADWHLQVFERLVPVYRKLFALEASDQVIVPPESIIPFEIVRQDSSATAEWIDLGRITCASRHTVRNGAPPGRGRSKRGTWPPILLAAFVLLVIVAVSPERPDAAWFEGQWVERLKAPWEGASDETYEHYVRVLDRQGPRRFVFTGHELRVQSQEEVLEFWFDVSDEQKQGSDKEMIALAVLILRNKRDHERSKAYLERHGDDQMVVRWTGTGLFADVSLGDRELHVADKGFELIQLERSGTE